MKIFENAHFQCHHVTRSTDRILITYSPLLGPKAGQNFWGEEFCEKIGVSALGLVAYERTWYPASQLTELVAKGREATAGYKEVYSYGKSMGGYGALKWGKALGASVVVAFSPQISINPMDLLPFKTRFASQFLPELNKDMMLRRGEMPRLSYIFYDPYYEEDRAHAEAIAALGTTDGRGGPVVRLVGMPSTDHHTFRIFAGTEKARRILECCFRDDLDGARRYTAELRRPHPQRLHTLSLRLLPKRVDAAMATHQRFEAAAAGGRVYQTPSEILRTLGPGLDKAGRQDLALEIGRKLVDGHPDDPMLMITFQQRLRRRNLMPIAAEYERKLERPKVRNPELAVILAEVALRTKAENRARLWAERAKKLASRRPVIALRTARSLAAIYIKAGRPEDALPWVRDALELAPSDEALHGEVLTLLLATGQLEKVAALEAGQEVDDVHDVDRAIALAEAAARLQRPERAARWAQLAQELMADDAVEQDARSKLSDRLSKLLPLS